MSESTKVSAADAIDALNNLDDYARMANIAPKGEVQILLKFILQNSEPSELTECETVQHLAFFTSIHA